MHLYLKLEKELIKKVKIDDIGISLLNYYIV